MLERLLAGKEQHAARDLLNQHRAAAPPYASLLGAATRHRCELFLKWLLQEKDSLGGDDPALVEALHCAVRRKFLDAALLLMRHGAKFFGDPAKGIDLLDQLVTSDRTPALRMLIESGQLTRDMVFLNVIRHRKVQVLTALQRHFQISFCAQVNSLMRSGRLAPCTSFLSELMNQLRFAAHAGERSRERMMCALAQAGLGYSSSNNLVTLRERLMRTELGGRDHFAQQFLLAMAAFFSVPCNAILACQLHWPI